VIFPRSQQRPGTNPTVRGQNSRGACKAIIRGLLSPPNPTPSGPVGGEVVYLRAPKPVCVEGLPGTPASTGLGNPKLGWLKTLKNWASNRNFTRSDNGNHFVMSRSFQKKSGAAQSVPGEVPKLAVLRSVAAVASPGRWINRRHKCIRIEPLNRARLCDAGNVLVPTIRINTNRFRAAGLTGPKGSIASKVAVGRSVSNLQTRSQSSRTRWKATLI